MEVVVAATAFTRTKQQPQTGGRRSKWRGLHAQRTKHQPRQPQVWRDARRPATKQLLSRSETESMGNLAGQTLRWLVSKTHRGRGVWILSLSCITLALRFLPDEDTD